MCDYICDLLTNKCTYVAALPIILLLELLHGCHVVVKQEMREIEEEKRKKEEDCDYE